MSLKIAYISDERFPSIHTDTQQVMKTIDALGRAGSHVDLIQPRKWQHWGKSNDARMRDICEYYNIEGHFQIRDIPFWPASDLRAEKLFHGILAPVKALMGNYDAVYTRNIIPLFLTSRLGVPTLFETYRALPDTNPKIFRIVKKASLKRGFIGLSTHSEYARQVMVDNGIAAEKIKTIPNGYDPREHAQLPDKDAARSILNLTADEKIIAYTGQIRPDKGVDALLDTAQVCPETTMLIVGGSVSEVAELQKMAAQRQLSNVRLVSQVPIREVPTYLAAADILILPPSSLPLKSATVLPMKTFTYMAAGKPIVAPEQPDTRGVLIHERNCLTVPPDMPSATAVAIRSILSSPSLARQLSNNARQDATQYTWDGRAAQVIAFVKEKLARS